jgi:hypothetical protein
MRLIAATMFLLTVTPCLAVYETDGVRLRGFAYTPFSNSGAVRISLRLQTVYDEISATTSGIFDCRAQAGLHGTCPSSSPGVIGASIGYSDVMGDVSSASFHVSFPDGASCDFEGVSPLPLNGGPKFLRIRSPLVLVAGSFTCEDATLVTTVTGNFFTTGSRLAIPKCKDGIHLLCSPV